MRRLLTIGPGLALLSATLMLTGCPAPPPADSGVATGGQPAGGPAAGPAQGGSPGLRSQWGPADGIVIGGFMSLTGDISSYGTSSNMAMGMATEELNAAGGVLGGKSIQMIMEDTASDQAQAINAARRLLDKHHAVALVGEVASSLSLAVAPVAQEAGIPMLSPSSTNPTLTAKGDYVFRACFTDNQQGAYVARFALKRGYQNGAILQDVGQDYSKGLAKVIEEVFTQGGGKIVAKQSYTSQDKDFSAPLTNLKSQQLDVIFLPGYYTEAGLIIKEARQLGITAPFVGGDGWDSPKLVEIAGEHVDQDCYFVNHYAKSDPRPKVKAFVDSFRQRYGEDPDALAACAYDAMYIVADAINRAGSTDPKKLRDALAATKDFDGVTGTISINAQRDALKPCVVLGFQNQQQSVVDHITLSDI